MEESLFKISTPFKPTGDQPQAIDRICANMKDGADHQVLLGVTGSGKTFTMAHVIARMNRPALIVAPNKTLAAQLFTEMKEIFPENAVGFFISYYDYYQPEAYLPGSDTYIAKDSSINEDIDKMRHAATRDLFERRDTIIVASVSCIYGLGSPKAYAKQVVSLKKGMELSRTDLLRHLVDIQYSRNDVALGRGSFRVRGDVVDILPSHQADTAIRVEFFGDEVEELSLVDALTGKIIRQPEALSIYPNSHYVTERENMQDIVREILRDLGQRLREFKEQDKLVEFQRLEQRTMQDVELLEQLGFCPGIENYSRYLTGLPPGSPPPTLLDYFPDDFITILDESHITVPQLGAMFRGDRSRKQTLVDFGFRLPAALDNRPLNFEEFLRITPTILHVSATPGSFETDACAGRVIEQIIRPTGLIDPAIVVHPAKSQVDDLYSEILKTTKAGGRVLVTTLTKKMAEDLTSYYENLGVRVRYLHSDIDSLERSEILRELRQGEFDVLIGINLLREGLDLPEVMLVAVMDADKQGFLRSRSSLIQTVGRAARNAGGRVIFYADSMSEAMRQCMDETERRRRIQMQYNTEHGIEPKTIAKKMPPGLRELYGLTEEEEVDRASDRARKLLEKTGARTPAQLEKLIRKKSREMKKAAADLDFEAAAELRDTIAAMKELLMVHGDEAGFKRK